MTCQHPPVATKLALVLPGGGYTPLGPAIRFSILALEQLGFEARDVSYPEVEACDGTFPWDDFSAATAERIEAILSAGDWTETAVVAKSLGTGVLARIGSALDVPRPRAIWLTPLFGAQRTREGAIALGWPSLIVAGTADDHHDSAGFNEVVEALDARTLLVDGADHGLEIAGDARATVAAMAELVDAVDEFARC